MRLNRTVVAVVLLAVLLLAAVPAAQAAPLAKPQTSSRILAGDWLSAALTWLGHLFADRSPQAPASREKATSTTSTSGGTVYPTFGNNNFGANCIDPNGCFDSGGGG